MKEIEICKVNFRSSDQQVKPLVATSLIALNPGNYPNLTVISFFNTSGAHIGIHLHQKYIINHSLKF